MPQQSKVKLQFDGTCWFCGGIMRDLGAYWSCVVCQATYTEIPDTILPVLMGDERDDDMKGMGYRPRPVKLEEKKVKHGRRK